MAKMRIRNGKGVDMDEIFTAIPAEPCGNHDRFPVGQRDIFSCSCGLSDAGCYMIHWDGPGLGFVCENEEDGKRKAFMMNVAWQLAKETK